MNIPVLSKSCRNALKGKHVFCSLSGGSDSLALFFVLEHYSAELKYSLEVVHFEHGFRGLASLDDARFCRRICEENHIPFRCIELNVPSNKTGSESDETAARRLRLAVWKDIVTDSDNMCVALGHNANDRVENLFLRLFRGSNTSALTSLREIQTLNGIIFVRPLLAYTKNEIENTLRENGVMRWCNDSTNTDNVYRRNFIRNTLLPLIDEEFPFAKTGLRQAIRVMESDATFLEQSALEKYIDIKGVEDISFDFWKGLHPALFIRVLRLWLSDCLGYDYVPDAALTERFSQALKNTGTESVTILLKDTLHVLVFRKNKVHFSHPENIAELHWNWRAESIIMWNGHKLHAVRRATDGKIPEITAKNTAVFDSALLPDILTVSSWKHGEKMLPFSSKTEKTLKKIFSDAGLGVAEKKQIPVIRANGIPIWLPEVRHSAFAVVSETTEELVIFSISR